MECTNARLLLHFVRTGELDRTEQEAIRNHLTNCPECAALAQAESRWEDGLATAMVKVPVPRGLKTRVLQKLARNRVPRVWPWVAAAIVLLATGLGTFLVLNQGPEEFEAETFAVSIDEKNGARPEVVEAMFRDMGVHMAAPRIFNYNLLNTFDTAEVQGKRVARLTFLSRTDNGAALAYVYVLPSRYFKKPEGEAGGVLDEIPVPASSHNILVKDFHPIQDYFYVVVYTSGSLQPFFLRAI